MNEILKRVYWSKSKVFLLPLTGITSIKDFTYRCYIKWGNFSIENYQLIVKIEYGYRYEVFQEYLRTTLLSNHKAFVTEIYDFNEFSVLIFDISEWASDIRKFIKGEYSKMSTQAKETIYDYNLFYKDGKWKINLMVNSCLYPKVKRKELDNMTPIDYAIKHYVMDGTNSKIDLDTERVWREMGELCSKCIEKNETLELEVSQNDTFVSLD
jgi:hypothetical protein